MEEKEILEKLVQECNSFKEILRKQGKSISGASVKILKEKLSSYNISYHFLTENTIGSKKELSEILVENSSYKSSDLKKRLIAENLKQDVCEICGQTNS
jgi:antitoxin component HigA of HigAB toxin-antitoxin module